MSHKKVIISGTEYTIGQLTAEEQFRMLHFIQKYDDSETFFNLAVLGFNESKEIENKDKAFNQLAMIIMHSICKSVGFVEYKEFCDTMLSRTFKKGGKETGTLVNEFRGNLKDYEILVAESMRAQFSDFFQLKDQSIK